MSRPHHQVAESASLAAAVALLCASGCGSLNSPTSPPPFESAPPEIVRADSFAGSPAPTRDRIPGPLPAALAGQWRVETGGVTCILQLEVNGEEIAGYSEGCSSASRKLPVAIGLLTGISFLFQTGESGDGWIWSGRYDRATGVLEGRREHVVTGELESFTARR